MDDNNFVINYNSTTYNSLFFKKREKKELLLKIRKSYLKYVESPYDYIMTFKINSSRRALLFNNLLNEILNKVLIKYNLLDVKNIIKTYVGCGINNIYIEDESWNNIMTYLNKFKKD